MTEMMVAANYVASCWRIPVAPLLALLASHPACADITATYRAPHSPSATMIVEVADDGSFRASGQGEGYELWSNGAGYDVEPGPGGPIVMATADIEAARAGRAPPYAIDQPWVALDKITIGGFEGTRFKIRGAEGNPEAASLVMSSDPSLAALGNAFRRLHRMQHASFPGERSPEFTSFRAALATGAPVDYLDWQLVSVSRAPIPRTRFDLPATPLSRAEVADLRKDPPQPPVMTADELRRERERAIRRAVFAQGRLWMLNQTGGVMSLAQGEKALRQEPLAGRVLDLCVRDGRPEALLRDGEGTHLMRLNATWSKIRDVSIDPKEIVAGMSCSPTRTLVLTDTRVIELGQGEDKTVSLSAPLRAPAVVTTLLDDGALLYVGLDAGEWGGGLVRIDLMTGTVIRPSKTTNGACGGPLFPGCDPVNGVAREPSKPGCVVVAIGLVHMFSHGRLTEVCGEDARRLYHKPYTVETSWPADPATEPFRTVAFFGLAQSADGLTAVGTDGIYSIAPSGRITFRTMPSFEIVDGLAVSFAVPGIVLLRTSINGQVSLSGAVPMIVAR